ncbi:MAG: transposase [bacterium]
MAKIPKYCFNVHSKGKINGGNGEHIEKVARYMSRAAISFERVKFNPDDNTIIVFEKQDRSPSCKRARYTLLEFMAFLAGHMPSPYEYITLYFGVYSSSYRGKEKRENTGYAKAIVEEKKGKGKASSTWARLIQKIFE